VDTSVLRTRHPASPGRSSESGAGRGRLPRWAQRRGPVLDRGVRVLVNLAGAAAAAWFAQASFAYYVQTHRLIGGLFFVEQAWFVGAFLLRRPARTVSAQPGSWLLAAGGTFGGVLLRPAGYHPLWGVRAGLVMQVAGLIIAIVSLAALGRSFGFVAADRGLVSRGPYAVVRHPVYAAYLLIQGGYVVQAMSWPNLVVLLLATSCNAGRIVAEERVLRASTDYDRYRQRVRWRLVPGLW
jgi:protein-S-isoprenylcysteine O-methyltransferase Ste14